MVLIGLPGTGKSTLVESIQPAPNYISLGEITRAELQTESELAREIRSHFTHHQPWPAEFVVRIVARHILRAKETGFVLDGIPRQKSEAAELVSWAARNDVEIDLTLYLGVEESIAFQRISQRRDRRPESVEHYRTRIQTFLEQKDELLDIMFSYASKSFVIDTSSIPVYQVKELLVNFVASNF